MEAMIVVVVLFNNGCLIADVTCRRLAVSAWTNRGRSMLLCALVWSVRVPGNYPLLISWCRVATLALQCERVFMQYNVSPFRMVGTSASEQDNNWG